MRKNGEKVYFKQGMKTGEVKEREREVYIAGGWFYHKQEDVWKFLS
jgi:hypothetical protein